jgi:hypothetical protein
MVAPKEFLRRYNDAVAHYRAGDRVAARTTLNESLPLANDGMAAAGYFLLGNCDYANVVAGGISKDLAIAQLRTAIGHYRNALALNSNFRDARANIELAEMLIEQMESATTTAEDSAKAADPSKVPNHEEKDGGGNSQKDDPSSGNEGKSDRSPGEKSQGDSARDGNRAKTPSGDTSDNGKAPSTRARSRLPVGSGQSPAANDAASGENVQQRLARLLEQDRRRASAKDDSLTGPPKNKLDW